MVFRTVFRIPLFFRYAIPFETVFCIPAILSSHDNNPDQHPTRIPRQCEIIFPGFQCADEIFFKGDAVAGFRPADNSVIFRIHGFAGFPVPQSDKALRRSGRGIEIQNMAPMFRNKLAEPYYVHYEYEPELQDKPIHLTRHAGQEFDFVISGRLKMQVGDNIEYLSEGDSIFYNSSTPHGMIAVDCRD